MYIYGEVFSTEVLCRGFGIVFGEVAARSLLHYMYMPPGMSFGRGMRVVLAETAGRMSVLSGLWRLVTVFASAPADAETGHKCHRRQARRARQEPDGQTLKRRDNLLSGSGTNIREAVQRHDLRSGHCRGGEASSPDITTSAVADTLPPEGFHD